MKEVKKALRAYCREKMKLEKEFDARMSYLLSEGKTGKDVLKELTDWFVRAEKRLSEELSMNVDIAVGLA